jgi:hypothetical protein
LRANPRRAEFETSSSDQGLQPLIGFRRRDLEDSALTIRSATNGDPLPRARSPAWSRLGQELTRAYKSEASPRTICTDTGLASGDNAQRDVLGCVLDESDRGIANKEAA